MDNIIEHFDSIVLCIGYIMSHQISFCIMH